MYTFQDYEAAVAAGKVADFIAAAIKQHIQSDEYKIAVDADEYDRQRDVLVNTYTKFIAEHSGSELVNATAANNRISSNFFHRLNTQRCAYSLGNGVDFSSDGTLAGVKNVRNRRGVRPIRKTRSTIKDRLGPHFDRDFYRLAYCALKHGQCFGFWNNDRLYIFPLTEFVPLCDEITGALRAGIRFWRMDDTRPVTAVLYAEDGYTRYRTRDNASGYDFAEVEPRRAYITHGQRTAAEGFEVIGYENYSTLPVIRMWGSDLHQSTLVGMKERIDSYDLIQSGFANDLQDCAQIYWIIENCGGMSDADLQNFLNKLNRDHIATADTKSMGVESTSLKPYVQDVPFESRTAYLQHIRGAIYEDFGALDVTNMSASTRTATEIESAYQPMDENADDFEYQCIDFIQQLLALMGITGEAATPIFKRNRIANQYEQTQMIMLAAQYLDDEAILDKLPWISVDEVADIMARKDAENAERTEDEQPIKPTEPTEDEDAEQEAR